MRVESAKTDGRLRECFVIEETYVGNVFVPAPFTNDVMTTSSMESVNARSPPATMPGSSIGSCTWKNAYHGPAPRSYAASVILSSKSARRASTVIVTYDTQNVTCATRIVQNPHSIPHATKSMSSEMPMRMSGMTSGV